MDSDETNRARLSFEEFKLFYESAEKVTDRRLELNRWNYSICVAIIVAIAAIAKTTLSSSLFPVGLVAIAVLCVVAILFCFLWVGQIRDFKNLNNAKFEVLNEMAPNIEFDAGNPGRIISYCPFAKEWKKLADLKALDELGRTNIIALKSSNLEYFIPKAFAALFFGLLVLMVIVGFTKWRPPNARQASPNSSSAVQWGKR
jgi:nitrogen fixation-related uncharacterized protein